MDFFADLLNVVVPGVVVAVVASLVTVHLSLRRFHAQKWWEKKEAAYSNLIEVVHKLKEYARRHHDRDLGVENPSVEEIQEIEKQWKVWNAEYQRLRDLAAFHVSDAAVRILNRYDQQKIRARDNDIYKWIEQDLIAGTECLEALIQEARRDLRAK